MDLATKKLMGFEAPGDQKVLVTTRDWDAMKRAVWRSAKGWEGVASTADALLDRCEHVEGCLGITSDTEPCLADKYETPAPTRPRRLWARILFAWFTVIARLFGRQPKIDTPVAVLVSRGCPDREFRMSALVMLTTARQFAPVNAPTPADQPFFAPTREYYSEVLATLGAYEIEIKELREKISCLQLAAPPPPKEIT